MQNPQYLGKPLDGYPRSGGLPEFLTKAEAADLSLTVSMCAADVVLRRNLAAIRAGTGMMPVKDVPRPQKQNNNTHRRAA